MACSLTNGNIEKEAGNEKYILTCRDKIATPWEVLLTWLQPEFRLLGVSVISKVLENKNYI